MPGAGAGRSDPGRADPRRGVSTPDRVREDRRAARGVRARASAGREPDRPEARASRGRRPRERRRSPAPARHQGNRAAPAAGAWQARRARSGSAQRRLWVPGQYNSPVISLTARPASGRRLRPHLRRLADPHAKLASLRASARPARVAALFQFVLAALARALSNSDLPRRTSLSSFLAHHGVIIALVCAGARRRLRRSDLARAARAVAWQRDDAHDLRGGAGGCARLPESSVHDDRRGRRDPVHRPDPDPEHPGGDRVRDRRRAVRRRRATSA